MAQSQQWIEVHAHKILIHMTHRSFKDWFERLSLAAQTALVNDKWNLANRAYIAGMQQAFTMSPILLHPLNDGCKSCAMSEFNLNDDFTSGTWNCKADLDFIQLNWIENNAKRSPAERTDPTPCYSLKKQTKIMTELANATKVVVED